ncbi:MAG: Gfo/Idh/MocA family oxidoreductase [Vicinamibacterales bacterium]
MRVGLIGAGAIAKLHARVHKNLGHSIRVCTAMRKEHGRQFAGEIGAEFVDRFEDVCAHHEVDFVDVCTFPDFRLQAVEACAKSRKPIQVQKPIATSLDLARSMVETARTAGIVLGVVSQHRFDESVQFVASAIRAGRLGELLQCDAYVKWHRTDEYYARPVKGTWATEGGGALISQAIHQVDLLRWIAGPVTELFGMWQIGAAHRIESEDMVSAVLRYQNGATGVIQASTAIWPGYPERLEFHGRRGTAVISGDQLVTWDVQDDSRPPPPLGRRAASGASDPMAISLAPFERQFADFVNAFQSGGRPLVSGEDGYNALEVVDAVYRSCRTGQPVHIP